MKTNTGNTYDPYEYQKGNQTDSYYPQGNQTDSYYPRGDTAPLMNLTINLNNGVTLYKNGRYEHRFDRNEYITVHLNHNSDYLSVSTGAELYVYNYNSFAVQLWFEQGVPGTDILVKIEKDDKKGIWFPVNARMRLLKYEEVARY